MDIYDIDIFKINKLIKEDVSKGNLTKRIYRAKKAGDYHEYIALSIARARLMFLEDNEVGNEIT